MCQKIVSFLFYTFEFTGNFGNTGFFAFYVLAIFRHFI